SLGQARHHRALLQAARGLGRARRQRAGAHPRLRPLPSRGSTRRAARRTGKILRVASQESVTRMGDTAVSDFSLPATGGKEFRLSAVQSRRGGLYFYPHDSTPRCLPQSHPLPPLPRWFLIAGASVYGISRDCPRSHESFKSKMGFPFDLLSDEAEKVCKQFDVMKLKNMYGKKVRGIERSTFVLDNDRVIRREWRGVKAPGHAQEVLAFVEAD